jgi:hypothetical protein
VERDAFQNTIDEIAARRPEAEQAKPQQFYDNSLVQELIKEGFFKSLGAKLRRQRFGLVIDCKSALAARENPKGVLP